MPDGFTERYGLLQYEAIRRRRHLFGPMACEVCTPVLDHDHRHGFVRGWLCSKHNGQLRRVDRDPVLCSSPWQLPWLRRCPECAYDLPDAPLELEFDVTRALTPVEERAFWRALIMRIPPQTEGR